LGHKLTVFISYRRDDAAASAGRLFDWLARQFGRGRVFLDTDKIAAGDEFPRKLEERLAASDVLVAVIGPRWLAISDARGRRIDQPDDFVRREIASAFQRGVRVAPVLVGGARVPRAEELPEPLKPLAGRHATAIDDAKFERDFDLLVDDLLGRRGFVRIQLDRVQRVVYVAKWSLLLVPALALVSALAVWTHVLDFFTIDSRVAAYVMRAADAVSAPRPEPPVLIAALDAATYEKLGRVSDRDPAWRRDHARLIERAARAGASAIAFDLFFREESAADDALAQAARLARLGPHPMRVVFAVKELSDGQPVLAPALRADGSWGSGCFFRRLGLFEVPLAVVHDPGTATDFFQARTPALALAAARDEALDDVDVSRRQFVGASPARYSAVERMGSRGTDCRMYAPEDDLAMLFMRPSPLGTWRQRERMVSYAELLDADAAQDERLRNRIVLVGIMRPGVDELEVERGLESETIHGVELHADAIANLVSGGITTPTVGRQAWITVAMVLAGAAVSVFSVTLSRAARRWMLVAAAGLYVVATVGAAAVGHLLNVHYDLATFLAAHALLRRLQARRTGAGAGEISP